MSDWDIAKENAATAREQRQRAEKAEARVADLERTAAAAEDMRDASDARVAELEAEIAKLGTRLRELENFATLVHDQLVPIAEMSDEASDPSTDLYAVLHMVKSVPALDSVGDIKTSERGTGNGPGNGGAAVPNSTVDTRSGWNGRGEVGSIPLADRNSGESASFGSRSSEAWCKREGCAHNEVCQVCEHVRCSHDDDGDGICTLDGCGCPAFILGTRSNEATTPTFMQRHIRCSMVAGNHVYNHDASCEHAYEIWDPDDGRNGGPSCYECGAPKTGKHLTYCSRDVPRPDEAKKEESTWDRVKYALGLDYMHSGEDACEAIEDLGKALHNIRKALGCTDDEGETLLSSAECIRQLVLEKLAPCPDKTTPQGAKLSQNEIAASVARDLERVRRGP